MHIKYITMYNKVFDEQKIQPFLNITAARAVFPITQQLLY